MRKKAVRVEVRKWVACSEPGCKRRALTKSPYCKEHRTLFEHRTAQAKEQRRKREAARAARRKRAAAKATSPRAERAAIRAKWLDLEAMREKEALGKTMECFEPGCRRRAVGNGGYCKEHQKKWDKRHLQAQTSDAKKSKKKISGAAPIKDPGSRLLKAYCEKCGYTIRLSRKWIDVKRPMCPVCMKNMVTELDGLIDADPRQLPLKPIKKRGMIKQRSV